MVFIGDLANIGTINSTITVSFKDMNRICKHVAFCPKTFSVQSLTAYLYKIFSAINSDEKTPVINVSYRLSVGLKFERLQITSNYLPSICKIEYLAM